MARQAHCRVVDAGTTAMNAVEKALERGFHRPLVLGAGAVGPPCRPILLSRGIDSTGNASVVRPGPELLVPKGTWVAASHVPIPDFDMAHLSRKELVILGVRAGAPEQLRQGLELAASGSIQLPAIRLYPLAETSRAIRDLADPSAGAKPVITVGPDVMDNPATEEGSMP